jgi:tRNA(His) guanylyltransferase
MSNKLRDRIDAYQASADTRLLPRVPVVIVINGRSFSKLTSLLDKPYDKKFTECILNTMLRLCTDVEGALFAYQHNDEIVVIARNDQGTDTAPWYDNRAQKISSVTSSIATLHFNRCATAIDLNLMGEAIFSSQVFVVPTIMEAINTLVYKQQYNFQTSIQFACFYELLNKYDKDTIKNMINGLTLDERIDLLQQESQVDFNQYPVSFRRGSACYKVPRVSENGIMKNKWFINPDLPIFTKDQAFLSNIAKNGADIFRQESF